jgi:hypothetical protein
VRPTFDLQRSAAVEADAASWHARSLSVRVGDEWTTLRLVRFDRGWLASADGLEGPTLGLDRSPYLAARRALEPLGVGLVAGMAAIAGIVEI